MLVGLIQINFLQLYYIDYIDEKGQISQYLRQTLLLLKRCLWRVR